jgi:hypothetical protein
MGGTATGRKGKHMNKTKKLALEKINLAMNEILDNLKSSSVTEDIRTNVSAMEQLAEAYSIIERGLQNE